MNFEWEFGWDGDEKSLWKCDLERRQKKTKEDKRRNKKKKTVEFKAINGIFMCIFPMEDVLSDANDNKTLKIRVFDLKMAKVVAFFKWLKSPGFCEWMTQEEKLKHSPGHRKPVYACENT